MTIRRGTSTYTLHGSSKMDCSLSTPYGDITVKDGERITFRSNGKIERR